MVLIILNIILSFSAVDHSQHYKLAFYAECWTKLRMWEMEEHERLIYLDADMLVCRNIDHLFHLPHSFFWAAPDCAAGRKTQAERDACALLRACCGEQPDYFNAGMFVMTPCLEQLEDFGEALDSAPIAGYAEQDFLNHYFKVR